MNLSVATYNLLANAHLLPQRYPDSPSEWMQSQQRLGALVEKVKSIGAEIMCLQEVEPATFDAISKRLQPLGYRGWIELRGGGEKEGCAIFYQSVKLRMLDAARLDYMELPGTHCCRRIAQIARFETHDSSVVIANTHLQWDAATTAPCACRGLYQIKHLAQELERTHPSAHVVICGDFNAGADSLTVSTLLDHGYQPTHDGNAMGPTCRANGKTRMIDFIFLSQGIGAVPVPLATIDHGIPMPGNEHPSDHIPVTARLEIPPTT